VKPVDGGLAIAPARSWCCTGGNRLGLLKLKSALKKGSKVAMTLQFEKAVRLPCHSMCSVPLERTGSPQGFAGR